MADRPFIDSGDGGHRLTDVLRDLDREVVQEVVVDEAVAAGVPLEVLLGLQSLLNLDNRRRIAAYRESCLEEHGGQNVLEAMAR